MLIGFNILLVALVLFIGYWWGNQGFFSSVLHLLCVIVAGGIALAVWEPLVTGVIAPITPKGACSITARL